MLAKNVFSICSGVSAVALWQEISAGRHSAAPAATKPDSKHDPRASHEVRITRNNTNNISCQFVSLIGVVSWIELFTQKVCSRKQEVAGLVHRRTLGTISN